METYQSLLIIPNEASNDRPIQKYVLFFALCIAQVLQADVAELTGNCSSTELPESRALHTKLGQRDMVETQYATITFRKKTHEEVYLTELRFIWNGAQLANPHACLFIKDPDKPLKPIPENHKADGIWSSTLKTLTFSIKPSIPLNSKTCFAITVTLDPVLEKQLRTGSFTLDPLCLPEPFRATSKMHPLTLSLTAQPSTQTIS